MKFVAVRIALVALVLNLSGIVESEVPLKNGNCFTGGTDIPLPGGIEPRLERVYNPKTSCKGWFGNGWGSGLEIYLEIEGDGSGLVREYGGGANNLFVPPQMTGAELNVAVEQIASVAKWVRAPPPSYPCIGL